MKWLLKGLGVLVLITCAIFIFGNGTMYLWNWLMPYLFHLPTIDFYQALGLILLSKIFFGGLRGGGHWGRGHMLKAKWEGMSPDERAQFKARFAEKCRHKWGKTDVRMD